MPELLWKSYIDFEIEEGERENARSLYERLVTKSGHHKVWISYALFEAEPIKVSRSVREEAEAEDEEDEENVPMVPGDPERARQIFDRGYKYLREENSKANERNLEDDVNKLKKAVSGLAGFYVGQCLIRFIFSIFSGRTYLKHGNHLKRSAAQKMPSRRYRPCCQRPKRFENKSTNSIRKKVRVYFSNGPVGFLS